MLDIKFIRENKRIVQEGAKKKHIDVDIERLIELDDTRLKQLKEIENLRNEVNKVSKNIVRNQDDAFKIQLIEEMRVVKEDIKEREEKLRKIMEEWQKIMLQVPNVPDISVPEGKDESANKEIRKWGEIPKFDFEPKSHIKLMEVLNMVDFERGIKVVGFRGYFLKNNGALLSLAIQRFVLDEMLKKEFELFIAPSLVKPENFLATGHFPKGKDDIYKTQDGNYLTGTAEVPMTGYHMGEILDMKELPKKYIAISPCFRREAGSHGKDTKGLTRVHEFTKLEQFVLCEADHSKSVEIHEEITQNVEEILKKLELPYRIVICSTGDMSQGAVKTYDIETWIPSEKVYRETHSSSYYHDFQARRAGIRYKNENGKKLYVHSLNNTAIAVPRILIPIIENNQQADGSIKIPEVLRKYMGGKEFIK